MIRTLFILILLFYILALLQTSFLVYFSFWGYLPNLVLAAVILLNLFQKPENYSGFLAAFIGGFFWDIFSSKFFGFWVLILLATAVFIKFVLRKYVKIPVIKKV